MNLVEKAQKVMLFKANIAKECKKRGMKMPSDEKISEYINGGYSITLEDFMIDYTLKEGVFRVMEEPSPLEKATLEATIKHLDAKQLQMLWNHYVEERDCGYHVFDLADDNDCNYIYKEMPKQLLIVLSSMVCNDNARFVQIDSNDNSRVNKVDIRKLIESEWSEIFARVMLFPECYEIPYKSNGAGYFTTIFAPIMIEMLGYKVDQSLNEVTYKKEGDK